MATDFSAYDVGISYGVQGRSEAESLADCQTHLGRELTRDELLWFHSGFLLGQDMRAEDQFRAERQQQPAIVPHDEIPF